MVSFLLDDGRVVVAEKDCGCLPEIHSGPHWLYMDDYYKRKNHAFLEQNTVLGYLAFVNEEMARLRILEAEMTTRHIVKIIREDL
ncbi:MAG: hypothetical protein ABWK53_10360 [Anaerolineales bacterium]